MYNASIISLIYWYAPAFCPLPFFRSRRCFGLYGYGCRPEGAEGEAVESADNGAVSGFLSDEGEYL